MQGTGRKEERDTPVVAQRELQGEDQGFVSCGKNEGL